MWACTELVLSTWAHITGRWQIKAAPTTHTVHPHDAAHGANNHASIGTGIAGVGCMALARGGTY